MTEHEYAKRQIKKTVYVIVSDIDAKLNSNVGYLFQCWILMPITKDIESLGTLLKYVLNG